MFSDSAQHRDKVTVVWTNNTTFSCPMSRHRVILRPDTLSFRRLHLDQVVILFRPSLVIGDSEFTASDSKDKSWYAETQQLLVRVLPGVRNVLYTTDPTLPGEQENGGGASVSKPNQSIVYSAALTQVPTSVNSSVESNYWLRTYRPVRDLPVAYDVDATNELWIELQFPMLFGNHPAGTAGGAPTSDFLSVPNYRILKVFCEFSIDH